mgnify:CR=1 FL=1
MKKDKNLNRKNEKQTASVNIINSGSAVEDKLLLYAYLLACLLPSFGAIDTMGSHWMFLAGLNIISSFRLYRLRSLVKVNLLYNMPLIFFSAFSICSNKKGLFRLSPTNTRSIISVSCPLATTVTPIREPQVLS